MPAKGFFDDAKVIPLTRFSLFFSNFCILNTSDDSAGRLFSRNGIRVRYWKAFTAEKFPRYEVIFCKCRKKDRASFLSAVKQLPATAILRGYTDYESVYTDTLGKIQTECGA